MIRAFGQRLLENLRLQLASGDALRLSLLGLCSGLLAGAVIIVFRQAVETTQAGFLPGGLVEHYEGLSPAARFLIPAGGGVVLGVVFQFLGSETRRVGVVHVMERLAYHQGHLPLRSALAQFLGAGLSIISGHSVGREGPSIHLGSASGSLLGQWLGLPNNSIRNLVACGAAAAIAASFNTPIAGVIFAMEVVMMEYTIAGFAPVILAAVSATALTRAVYGSAPAFRVPALELASLLELPYVVLMGLVVGALAAVFIALLKFFAARGKAWPVWLRLTAAGILTGALALPAPEIMGIGYDTVNSALLGELGLGLLLLIVAAKLLATTAGVGLGLPGGLIGPTLVIGASAGGLMGLAAGAVFPGEVASHGFYAMIGMGAMMGATLQAPLAALMAMLELTANPNIILPGMLAVIAAGLTSRELFGHGSVFVMLLRVRGLDYRNDPLAQSLRRTGVAGIMERNFVQQPPVITYRDAQAALENHPVWILVEDEQGQPASLLPAMDLARYAEEHGADAEESSTIDLMDIPALRQQLAPVNLQATLQEAVERLDSTQADALYVWRMTAPQVRRIYGVLTRNDIESAPLR